MLFRSSGLRGPMGLSMADRETEDEGNSEENVEVDEQAVVQSGKRRREVRAATSWSHSRTQEKQTMMGVFLLTSVAAASHTESPWYTVRHYISRIYERIRYSYTPVSYSESAAAIRTGGTRASSSSPFLRTRSHCYCSSCCSQTPSIPRSTARAKAEGSYARQTEGQGREAHVA